MKIKNWTTIRIKETLRFEVSYIAVAVFGLSFLTVGIIWSPTLSYWWDEFSLIQAHQKGALGFLDGHMGHFFPLGRAVLWLETVVFGDFYFLLVVFNGLILLTTVLMLQRQLFGRGSGENNPILSTAAGCLIMSLSLTSTGMWYDLQWGMQICWFLAVLFGVWASTVVLHNTQSYIRFYSLIFLSWLSLGSTSIAIFFLVSGLSLRRNNFNRKHTLIYLLVSIALTFLSSRLALFFEPIDKTALGWPTNFSVIFEETWEVSRWSMATAITWLATPVLFFLPTDAANYITVGTYVYNNSIVFAILLFLICLLIFTLHIKRTNRDESVGITAGFFLVGTVVASSLIVVSRIDNTQSFLHTRYAPLLQTLSMLFWFTIVLLLANSRIFLAVALRRVVLLALFSTVLFALWNSKETIESASEDGRISYTELQLEELRKCQKGQSIIVHPSIQPALSSEEMCKIAKTIRGLTE
jgi:hypothetical protein